MKLNLFCIICDCNIQTRYKQNKRYKVKCQNGHDQNILLLNDNFEILFSIAVNAIMDGYFREAVSSFAASLERFYEYYLRVVCRYHQVHIEDAWKDVASQSERQFGAFTFVYLMENSLKPPSLNNKNREFRNNVIHKGIIPEENEVIDFGQSIIDIIYPILREMQKRYETEIDLLRLEYELQSDKEYSYKYIDYSLLSINDNKEKPNLAKEIEKGK